MGSWRLGTDVSVFDLTGQVLVKAVIFGTFCGIPAELLGRSSFPLEVGFYDCLVTRGNAVAAGQQAIPRQSS
jgi:hypothetical protein